MYGIKDADTDYIRLTREERISHSKEQVKEIIRRVWIYILIGVGIVPPSITGFLNR